MDKSEKKSNRGRKPHTLGTNTLISRIIMSNIDPENPNKAKAGRMKNKSKNLEEVFKNRCQVCLTLFVASRRNSDLKGKPI